MFILFSFFKGKDPRPIGGFLSYIQNASTVPFPQQIPHHAPASPKFHFSSSPAPAHHVPSVEPWPSMSKGIPSPSLYELSSSHMPSGSQSQQFIDVESANEDGEMGTSRRLIWNPEEDLRLVCFYALIVALYD